MGAPASHLARSSPSVRKGSNLMVRVNQRHLIWVALARSIRSKGNLNLRWFAILTFCSRCNLNWAIPSIPIIRRTPIHNSNDLPHINMNSSHNACNEDGYLQWNMCCVFGGNDVGAHQV
ncbi:hypothetical protein HAX54_053151 [Datura stramonium]|uniref:Uncharacterized protein n=1 Tax=Datura stramonium TaxID=4076 RepID=A0ABS8WRQ9_DATST|nr:hypothetical protein [Datura stramonium]